jgi:transposase
MAAYSLDLRQKIVSAYAQHNSIRKVAAQFKVSNGFVHQLLQQLRRTGNLEPKPATRGRSSQLSRYETEITQMIRAYPGYTLAEYCQYLEDKVGIRLSASSMCRFLQKQNLTLKNHW